MMFEAKLAKCEIASTAIILYILISKMLKSSMKMELFLRVYDFCLKIHITFKFHNAFSLLKVVDISKQE